MFRWIIGWMASQEVGRRASNDPSACKLIPVSVPFGLMAVILRVANQ